MVYIDEKRIQDAFLEEVVELLENLNKKLLELEEDPTGKETINEIFRYSHSIKSEAALVGYMNMSTIAHKMEDIFERVRREELIVDTNIMNILFMAYDRIMDIIATIQAGGNDTNIEIDDVKNALNNILKENGGLGTEKKSEKRSDNKTDVELPDSMITEESVLKIGDISKVDFSDMEKNQIEDEFDKGVTFYKIMIKLDDECDMKYPRAYLVFNNFDNMGLVVKSVPDIKTETEDDKFCKMDIFLFSDKSINDLKAAADVDQVQKSEVFEISKQAVSSLLGIDMVYQDVLDNDAIKNAEKIEEEWAKEYAESLNKSTTDNSAEEEKSQSNKESDELSKTVRADRSQKDTNKTENLQKQTIRVDIERLDNLWNLVGELIITRSRYLQITDRINDFESIQAIKTEIEDATNVLDRITDQMQIGMMQARMVPIGNVFSKFPRMVRDLANQTHKNIALEITGESTEIDRTVIEHIAEPLTHLIRNSIDHGIEFPEERERVGKPREGKIVLKAYQEGSSIYIEIMDDGKGISYDKIKEKAISNGMLTAQQISGMSNQDILNLIFQPGFTTKEIISDLSGRGVGMDVVKTKIEKLRGRVEISTTQGAGSRFLITLPLTLTIVEALLVNVERNIFAIPISAVEETIMIKRSAIKFFDEYQIYDYRNETLALIFLAELVSLEVDRPESPDDELYIVVVSFEGRKVGLVVENLIGEQDIVIKSLDEVLRNNDGIAGASVLGDGGIALILDTSALVKAAIREWNKIKMDVDFYGEGVDPIALDKLYDTLNKEELKPV